MLKRYLLVLAVLFAPHAASADLYQITVTRKGTNLYQVDGRQIYILTRYCYEYAYSETAILDTSAMQITFVNSGGGLQCDVVKILK